MRNLNLTMTQTVTGTLLPVQVILIRKILTVKGPPTLLPEEAPLQDQLKKKGHVLEIPFLEKVLQGGRINSTR